MLKDEIRLASAGGEDKLIKIWNIVTGLLLLTIEETVSISKLLVLNDGRIVSNAKSHSYNVLVGNVFKTNVFAIRIYKINEKSELCNTDLLKGDINTTIKSLALLSDGTLISGSGEANGELIVRNHLPKQLNQCNKSFKTYKLEEKIISYKLIL